MNSKNWPARNVWVFVAQLVEHCSANAEAMGPNPVEDPKTFFGLNCDCLNRKRNCDDYTFISFVCPQFTQYSHESYNSHHFPNVSFQVMFSLPLLELPSTKY